MIPLRRLISVASLILVIASVAIACGDASPAPGDDSSSPGAAASMGGQVVLTVAGETTTEEFTLDEVRSLPPTTGYAGIKTSVGTIEPPVAYTGVSVEELADLVGGLGEDTKVTLVAKDGYGMTFSYDQVVNDEFVTFDPATGDEESADGDLTMLIAYEREGEPLDQEGEGPLRLVVAEATPAQVVDGHWSVKWVDRVEVGEATEDWTVTATGDVTTTLTKQSFTNCASPGGCHGRAYEDDDGRTWVGVPLYLVAGMVDDAKKHDAGAFNRRLARRGYEIEIVSADGSKSTLDSRDVALKDGLVLAYKVDGRELSADDFPLRLVGPGLTAAQSVGAIAKIELQLR